LNDSLGIVAALLIGMIGLVAYAVGSLSSGYLVGKLYRNVDLRRVGSGSTGATNTFRNLGPGAGVLVALLDVLKGAAAVWIARQIVPAGSGLAPVADAVAAIGAVVGHCWPAFLEGRGGRGVATGFGAFLFIATTAWAAAVIAFVLGLVFTRIVSVASLASARFSRASPMKFAASASSHGIVPASNNFIVASSSSSWRELSNREDG